MSNDAIADVRQYIEEGHGKPFLTEAPLIYKSKKDAQDAHEAIRPTSMAFSPEASRESSPRDGSHLGAIVGKRGRGSIFCCL